MLRRWMTTASLAGAIALVAACARDAQVGTTIEPGAEGQEGVHDTIQRGAEVAPADTVLPQWLAIISNVEESTVRGEAAFRSKAPGGTYAEIAIAGGEPNHAYPWHLHDGDCGEGGPIVGDPEAYPAIITDADGAGQTVADLTISLDVDDGDYYVNVHQSPEDLATIAACGDAHLAQR